jgi:hypothetical protein
VALPGFRLRRFSDGFIAICRGSTGVVVAGLAILLDLWRTGLWFSRTQIDPDLSRVAGPVQSYAHVLHDPFGFEGLQTGLRYPGAGRAMAHLTTKAWADHVLGWLPLFVSDPVHAVYLGLGGTAVLVHIGWLVVGCGYLRAYKCMSVKSVIFCALGLSLFVQLASQRFYLGIIDSSMSYTFAYAIPLLSLAAFFLPVYQSLLHPSYVPSVRMTIGLVPLAVYLAFSGPLVQPVVALLCLFLAGAQVTLRKRLLAHRRLIPGLGTLAILSAWGMYVSRFNSESATSVTLATRYKLLRHGLFQVLIRPSSPWPILLLALVFLYRFVSRSAQPSQHVRLRAHMLVGLGFSVLWLTLLPLGGYRNYRPFILSSVTLLPVTLIAAYLFVLLLRVALSVEGAAPLKGLRAPGRSVRIITFGFPVIVLVLLAFGKVMAAPQNNSCQRASFDLLRDETGTVLRIPRTCPMLTETIGALDDSDYQQAITKLLRRWRIIDANQTLK